MARLFRKIAAEGVVLALVADGRDGPVPGIDDGFRRQGEETLPDGAQQLRMIAAGEVGAPDGAVEQGVAAEDGIFRGKVDGDAARRMPGGIQNGAVHAGQRMIAAGNVLAFIGRDRRKTPDAALAGFRIQQTAILRRDMDGGPGGFGQRGHAVHMVKMQVRQNNIGNAQALSGGKVQHGGRIAAHVHGNGHAAGMHEIAVGLQRTKGKGFYGHEGSFVSRLRCRQQGGDSCRRRCNFLLW